MSFRRASPIARIVKTNLPPLTGGRAKRTQSNPPPTTAKVRECSGMFGDVRSTRTRAGAKRTHRAGGPLDPSHVARTMPLSMSDYRANREPLVQPGQVDHHVADLS